MPRSYWIHVATSLTLLCVITVTAEQYVIALVAPDVQLIVTVFFAFMLGFFTSCQMMVIATLFEQDARYPARSAKTLRLLRSLFRVTP